MAEQPNLSAIMREIVREQEQQNKGNSNGMPKLAPTKSQASLSHTVLLESLESLTPIAVFDSANSIKNKTK